jgi:POT family proton-dependent oligopeptide transporter
VATETTTLTTTSPTPDPTSEKHPPGLKFFFWGEFAERSSYYGMRAILFMYLTTQLELSDGTANEWYATFKMACYLLPLLGGFLADRYLGKYWTIVGFSVPYVIGQLLIGIKDETTVLFALALCAMGSGVIKPNISALLGLTYDQQRPGNVQLRARAFMWFYFSVNVGALISMLALPAVRTKYGYQVAFLIPAAFMAVALFIFAVGKRFYAVETVGPAPPKTPEEKAEQWRVLTRLFGVFALMVFFWMVYEHNDIQWVAFARDHIDLAAPGWVPDFFTKNVEVDGVVHRQVAPDQFQFINSLAVLVLIVFFQWFWKQVDPAGKRFPHTTKILLGFLFTAAAPATLALAAQGTAGGARVSMLWIVGAYIILTVGEVLVYGTMLDLSYAYAPARMKGFITACFLVTNTLGNLINSQYGKLYNTTLSPETFFTVDAIVAVAAAVAFFFVGRQFNRGNAAAA